MYKYKLSGILLALALGLCASLITSLSADDNFDDEYWDSELGQKKTPVVDYDGWKGDGRFYASFALNNNAQSLEFPSGAGVDGSDQGYHLGVGYNFNSFLSAELSLNDFGEISETDSTSTRVAFKTNSVDLALVGKYAIAPNLNIYGKLGVSNWKSQLDLQGVPVAADTFFRTSDSGSTVFIGGGVSYGLTRYVDVFAELDHRSFNPVFANTEYDASVSTFMVGFKFTFGKTDAYKNIPRRH